MIYTIGRLNDYKKYSQMCKDRGLKFEKRGRDDKYVGGSVWKTRIDAEKFRQDGYEVFGVIAEWDVNTVPSKDGDWHDLLVNSELVWIED